MAQEQSTSPASNNIGCAFAVLFSFFVLLFAMLAITPSPSLQPVVEGEASVVSLPTNTPDSPTHTPIPPTNTPAPTATPVPPTNTPAPTNTPMPTNTPIPAATSTPQTVAAAPEGESAGGANGASYDAALVADGQTQYMSLCIACHGPDARGMPNLGKDLVASEFVHSQTDDQLLTFIKTGRPIWDPANTTGIDMPPKGGNPALNDDQILAIIAYIRSLAS